ncbi:helix-turn-helix domain-containing protein [Catalinimonas alkaloidigena]|uniref:helix-turn-helix domain-containing protein n=1 Tax=Catalinimonas alkaloidigena TaxID=1075417 RepID=UPI0024050CAD|nr:helix-turn-helix domain-containing protein [Catalinimonas alkaloidigena]
MPEPFLDWLAVINLLGVVQGLFLAVIFFTLKKGNRKANRQLGINLFILAFIVLEIFLSYTGYIQYFPILVNLEEPVVFLLGPFTYLYTLSLLKPDFKFSIEKYGIHFLPALAQFIGRIPFYLQSDAYKLQDTAGAFHKPIEKWIPAEKIWYFPEYEFLVGFWLDVVTICFIFPYILYSILLIYKYAQKQNEFVWHLSNLPLRWLSRMLATFLVFMLLVAIFSFSSEDDLGDIYISLSCSFIFYGLSFYLISHLQELLTDHSNQTKKYERSVLDHELTESIRQKLESSIKNDKPFLNSELSLPLFAEQLGISHHHLSQVINEQYGLNFSDFINQHRVEEMKSRLTDSVYQHLKIEQIAFDTGFSSKSTFQAAFKKFTGLTPTQYRKSAVRQR